VLSQDAIGAGGHRHGPRNGELYDRFAAPGARHGADATFRVNDRDERRPAAL